MMTPTVSLLVGSSVLVISVLTKLLGEPDQIRRNWARRSTDGVSPVLYMLSFSSYCLWILHGLVQGDRFLIGAQSVGIVTSGIVLIQMWIYRVRRGARA
jgi:uncharacterized protein with PQ loop repeat